MLFDSVEFKLEELDKLYFDNNESKKHLQAKEELFDLIVSRRVKVLDQHGVEYKIFNGEHKDEFLHIESFVMDYSDEALFSNYNSPCKKYMTGNKIPECNMKGYFGAFKEFPCEKCVQVNYGEFMSGGNKFASYRADIACGHQGKHRIWLEIKNTSPCSKGKIEFCKSRGVTLLEIDANDVDGIRDKFNTSIVELKFIKLEEYKYEYNFYEELKNLPNHIGKIIEVDGYTTFDEVINFFNLKSGERGVSDVRNIVKIQNLIKERFAVIKECGDGLIAYFNLDKKRSIIVEKNDYDKYIFIESDYIPSIIRNLENELVLATKEMKDGFLDRVELERDIKAKLPKGYKRSIKFDEWYDKHKLIKIEGRRYSKQLNGLGIKASNRNIIISNDTYSKLNT